ncbi:MAG TPA: GNAT family N-acetyltransferase [Candidatus Limnocylindrales bacterium]|nr:GNAT family N-acetyltransferase [Candidatus Limnocylindrales bacterium]
MSYSIGFASAEDLPQLPPIEERAAAMFDRIEALRSVPLINSDPTAFEHAHAAGLLWVARDAAGAPVGFALCERLGSDIHLEELDVDPVHGCRGIGRALVLTVCNHAAGLGHDVTLTTFRDVPWNQPFYERLGFREIPRDEITPELAQRVADETSRGLPRHLRILMRRRRTS